MPDITMCSGENARLICPIRETCYRYTAKPNPRWQSWMNAPIAGVEDVCDSYWMNRDASGSGDSR